MGKELSDYTLSELDQWWEEAKKKGRSGTSSL
jgi:hypothetical protein